MLWKNVARSLVAVTVIAGMTACYSMRGKEEAQLRKPSSEACSVYDNFSYKGCEEVSHRNMAPGQKLSDTQLISELAGREIWYKSAPNGRMHTYAFGQRLGSPIDWNKVLRTDQRNQRFSTWGTINDPDCCTPGKDCDAKGKKYKGRSVTLKDTYGWDYCDGDEELLEYVGRPDKDYLKADPSCTNSIIAQADANGKDVRENSCHLAFGTSTGSVGFRKFPNPRFNSARWNKLQGWKGYTEREVEASIEPPFRVAISCASCHAAFEPTNPPADVNNPQWSNISGIVGNQYIRITDILSSATRPDSLENQLFVPTARPGTSDTSAVPNDFTNNPGTINAIINFPQRPKFIDSVTRWHKVERCAAGDRSCQKIKYSDGREKHWQWSKKDMEIFHILKGAEDTVGADLAVQRVYVNIGMCAEQCWMNHQTDMRVLHSTDRGFGQTPFDIAQCRRDCAPWRANEDRVFDIINFLLSARPSDLKVALRNQKKISGEIAEELDANFTDFLEKRYGVGSLERGRQLFAQNCATCHSSQNQAKADLTPTVDDFMSVDFNKEVTLPTGEIIRADWMGNDKSTRQDFIKTYQCRSRHTNHNAGHIWEQFASETYRAKPSALTTNRGPVKGGPGYYRNISLLNAWAHAPFLHNNALGPEICGRPDDIKNEKYVNPYVSKELRARGKACDMKFDPSIEGRLALFDASMDELLKPDEQRNLKMATSPTAIRLPLGLDIRTLGQDPRRFYLEFPAGTPIALIGSFDLKGFAVDLSGSLPLIAKPDEFAKYWETKLGKETGPKVRDAMTSLLGRIKNVQDLQTAVGFLEGLQKSAKNINEPGNPFQTVMTAYANCSDYYENKGHNISTDLPDSDKKALKAFLATF